ncbi:Pectinesterase inhibitor domain containing protein [Trema orientale]|uniref:Pectinesterase n=1 Tax=Trema orientale TaxID=63057 RepID=A0A2P5BUT0_TREOI|nr:Pectinesterase inhibitor domain containing protein [Trema orientale]
MSYGRDDGGKRKRFAVIGVSSFLLVAMVIAVTIGVTLNNGESSNPASGNKDGSGHPISSSNKAIKAICQPTDYREDCVKSLQSEAGNGTTDPKKLIQAGFRVAMKQISEAAKKSSVLKELEKDPRASKALGHCKQLMENAVDDLKNSFDKLGDFDITKFDETLMDLKVWLSATITYQETCLDGFQNTTGEAAEKMKAALKTSRRLSSNGLAMVSEISSVFSDLQLNRRRLLSDEESATDGEDVINTWYNKGVRRLLAEGQEKLKADVVVAKDGSGQFKTIKEALKDVPRKSNKTFVIYIKEGVYEEYVTVERNMTNLMIVGDGANKTRITGNKNFIDGFPTSLTATVVILGDHFKARDIGFENTAGAHKHQAVALRVNADEAIFYRCAMDGYQDTLYTHAKRQFYRECNISGTIDFIFGDAAVVFQNCRFIVRKPLENQQCIVTAQGRKERRQPSAIVIQNGTFVADPEYYPVRNKSKSYLGRPWKEFSRTIIMESYIDDLIQPQGWLPWAGDFAINTCFYSEFDNRGPGAVEESQRAKWRGVKKITAEHAVNFTPGRFFKGDWWIKLSGVPYVSGMYSTAPKNE